MARRWLTVLLAAVLFVLAPRSARADQPGAHTVPVAVLALDSEEAEEQADALTGALRSRIRASEGWSLVETTQSLGMMTAALRCPSRPPPDCQQRIAEQIKTDRYIWGVVSRGGPGQVTAEVHLYQKGKPDVVFKESYAENLKDANDDTLRKIAQRALERFGGSAVGALVVRAGNGSGEVVVDGEKRVPLQNGTARIELAPGGHAVEVSTGGGPPVKRNVLVTAGQESVVELAPGGGVEETGAAEKPFPTKKVLGGVALAVGVGLAALSVERTIRWSELKDEGEALKGFVPKDAEPCTPNTLKEFCDKHRNAQGASAVAWTAGVLGAAAIGAGVYFLFIDSGSAEKSTAAKRPRLTPTVGRGAGGLVLSGSF